MAGIFRRTVGILGQAALVGVVLIEDYLDKVGSGQSSEELLGLLHEARAEVEHLHARVADLEDQCIEYRYLLAQNPQPSHFGENMLGHIHGPSCDVDDYDDGFALAAANEGTRIAHELSVEADNDIPF